MSTVSFINMISNKQLSVGWYYELQRQLLYH
jgi:hypothetical protein